MITHTFPKDLFPLDWKLFCDESAEDRSGTKCAICKRKTWHAWRTGFCTKHWPGLSGVWTKDYFPDTYIILNQRQLREGD